MIRCSANGSFDIPVLNQRHIALECYVSIDPVCGFFVGFFSHALGVWPLITLFNNEISLHLFSAIVVVGINQRLNLPPYAGGTSTIRTGMISNWRDSID